jgi:hypothetical protein
MLTCGCSVALDKRDESAEHFRLIGPLAEPEPARCVTGAVISMRWLLLAIVPMLIVSAGGFWCLQVGRGPGLRIFVVSLVLLGIAAVAVAAFLLIGQL